MNPGDMIEWIYRYNGEVVNYDEELYSSTMKTYVPIGVPALLISITQKEYSWLSEKGLFHARVDDALRLPASRPYGWVVPRASAARPAVSSRVVRR